MSDLKELLANAQVMLQNVPDNKKAWLTDDATLERWAASPAQVDSAEHDQLCLAGVVMSDGDVSSPCPVCSYQKAFAKLRLMMQNCGIEARYLDVDWEDLQLELQPFGRLRRAAERVGGMFETSTSLLLHGEHGFGKTQCAMLLARAALEHGKTVRVVSLGELAMNVRAGYDGKGDTLSEPQAVALMSEPDLLVLEDFGAAEADSGAVEKRLLWVAANTRHNARKPTIITTNLTPNEFGKAVGGRILPRFQPLYPVAFSHGVNFRVPEGGVKPWF